MCIRDRDWYQNRAQFSHSNLLKELRISAPADLKNFLSMDSETYDELLEKVRLLIEKKDTIICGMRFPRMNGYQQLSGF